MFGSAIECFQWLRNSAIGGIEKSLPLGTMSICHMFVHIAGPSADGLPLNAYLSFFFYKALLNLVFSRELYMSK